MYSLILVAIGLALITHAVFRWMEPSALLVIANAAMTFLAVAVHAIAFSETALSVALLRAVVLNTVFFASLVASIAVYRLSPWHPLARFPGPAWAAMSKWWMVHCILIKGGRHLEMQRAHRRYGTWVRLGPNELSVNDPTAIAPIYTQLNRSNFHKGAPAKADTMITVIDRQRHAERRRTWTTALSTKANEIYGIYAKRRLAELLHHIDRSRSKDAPVDIDRWVNLFFVDLAGDIGFSGGFETMKDGHDKDGWMEMLGMGVRFVTAMGQVPWMRDILQLLPQRGPIETFHSFVEAKVRQIREEHKTKSMRVDIMGTLLDESAGAARLSTDEAVADAGLIIVGATDTSVQTVLTALRFLAADPYRLRKLQREVDTVFGTEHDDEIAVNISELLKLPYLNACINESFRILPPGPAGPARVTGPEGAVILGRWIPPHTTIHVPVYTMHRDPANFGPLAELYIPERWLSEAEQTEMITATDDPCLTLSALTPCNRQAFMPFSAGYANCVGRALGLQNVKLTLASIAHRFAMSSERGFDPAMYDASYREYGLWTHDPLRLQLSSR